MIGLAGAKRVAGRLREEQYTGLMERTWGTALTGNFSLGFINFLAFFPLILLAMVMFWAGFSMGTTAAVATVAAVVILFLLMACLTAAANSVFRAMLHCYATGKGLPDTVRQGDFAAAFRST